MGQILCVKTFRKKTRSFGVIQLYEARKGGGDVKNIEVHYCVESNNTNIKVYEARNTFAD